MPAAERDAVIFNILRLDPCQRRGSVSFDLVSDLAALWRNIAAANSKRPPQPTSLYPLPASKAEIEKQKAQAADQGIPELHFSLANWTQINCSPRAKRLLKTPSSAPLSNSSAGTQWISRSDAGNAAAGRGKSGWTPAAKSRS